MRRFMTKLDTCDTFKWSVQGLPVVAVFQRAENKRHLDHLGQPFSHNNESDILKLWIGIGEAMGEILVAITIRINVGAGRRTRRQARNKGRLMFLIVPTESLVLGSSQITYTSLTSHVGLRALLDLAGDEKSGECPIHKLSFKLVAGGQSHVIMPQESLGHPLQPQPLLLLRLLRSLCESTSFDLYANADVNVQSSVDHVQAMLLRSDMTMTTPKIELDELYPGPRQGAVNLWTNQGWTRDDLDNAQSVSQNHSRLCPLPPPVYESKPLQDLPSTVPYDLLPNDEPVLPSYQPNSNPRCDGIFLSKEISPIPATEASLSSNYSTELLSEPSVLPKACDDRVVDSLRVSSAVGECMLDEGVKSSHMAVIVSRSSSVKPKNVFNASSPSVVLDTPSRKRPLTSTPEGADEGNNAKRVSSALVGEAQDDMSVLPEGFMYYRGMRLKNVPLESPTETGMTCCASSPNSPNQTKTTETAARVVELANPLVTTSSPLYTPHHDCMVSWLIQAWTLCPKAHYIFISELLRLVSRRTIMMPLPFMIVVLLVQLLWSSIAVASKDYQTPLPNQAVQSWSRKKARGTCCIHLLRGCTRWIREPRWMSCLIL
jgi:hypothetical protein